MSAVSGTEAQRLRRRLVRIAYFMDNAIRVPVIGKRIGWDAVVGLVPGAGDIAGAAISGYIVFVAWRLGVPVRGLLRMIGNVGIETVGGAVPLLGDIFDMAFKANVRNVALVEKYLGPEVDGAPAEPGKAQGSSGRGVPMLLLAAVALTTVGAVGFGLLALTL